MTRPGIIPERPIWRLAIAIAVGLIVLAVMSELSWGLFPFFEFAVAAAVVYLIARR